MADQRPVRRGRFGLGKMGSENVLSVISSGFISVGLLALCAYYLHQIRNSVRGIHFMQREEFKRNHDLDRD